VFCHAFQTGNVFAGPYMNTANLPVRAEIENLGAVAGSNQLKLTSLCVLQEGGPSIVVIQAYQFGADSGTTGKSVAAGVTVPLVSIRVKPTFAGLPNRSKINVEKIGGMGQINPFRWQLIYNGTLTGAAFADVDPSSGVQSDTTATAISGGTVLATGYCDSDTAPRSRRFSEEFLTRIPFTIDFDGVVGDVLTLVATGTPGTASVAWGNLNWSEVR
jgi:hypothetical protein